MCHNRARQSHKWCVVELKLKAESENGCDPSQGAARRRCSDVVTTEYFYFTTQTRNPGQVCVPIDNESTVCMEVLWIKFLNVHAQELFSSQWWLRSFSLIVTLPTSVKKSSVNKNITVVFSCLRVWVSDSPELCEGSCTSSSTTKNARPCQRQNVKGPPNKWESSRWTLSESLWVFLNHTQQHRETPKSSSNFCFALIGGLKTFL